MQPIPWRPGGKEDNDMYWLFGPKILDLILFL